MFLFTFYFSGRHNGYSVSGYSADSNYRLYGMFGGKHQAQRLERHFVLPPHTVVRLTARFLATDEWKGQDHGYIKVDGRSIWKSDMIRPQDRCAGGFAPLNANNLYNPWSSHTNYYRIDKCFFDIDVTFVHKKVSSILY